MALEALLGQVFLVTLVARLVTLWVRQSADDEASTEREAATNATRPASPPGLEGSAGGAGGADRTAEAAFCGTVSLA